MKKLLFITIIFLFIESLAMAQNKWEPTTYYKNMKSSVNVKDQIVKTTGKDLWAKHCKSCHGSMGLGDGPKAKMLKTSTGDFSTIAFQSQTDGSLYYKTFVKGNGDMPVYDKKIVDENDRWALVQYMRTMKK